ncbi:MAG: acyl-CoA dehydrogenase, partial [Actinomycetota bacterium]|nr:acyl-CoA dehydrogenase [Actinomycetota bacterium]
MAIDFSLTPELEAIRARVRTFIDDVVKPGEAIVDGDVDSEPLTGKDRIRALVGMRKQALETGLWLPHMPLEWGGMGL